MKKSLSLVLLFSTFFAGAQSPQPEIYLQGVRPILQNKCINCHGCNGSPCEMKLDSYAAIDRGANKTQPFSPRLREIPLSRMKDAKSTAEWRQKGFFEVIPGRDVKDNSANSLLYLLAEAGSKVNPDNLVRSEIKDLMEESQKLGDRVCPKDKPELNAFLQKYPHGGMPMALPGLTEEELATIKTWIDQGAPGPSAAALAELKALKPAEAAVVAKWEAFFNGEDQSAEVEKAKAKLVSRYLYEHVFMAHIVLDGVPNKFFELIRSRTSAPAEPDEIVTEVPMDDPGPSFVYRLRFVDETIVQKSHMVWSLNNAKLARLKKLFFEDWKTEAVTPVPYFTIEKKRGRGKDPDTQVKVPQHNPFINFAQIPALSRARWVMDETKLFANGTIRGPVCTGVQATYAIRDHFWIFFVDPEHDVSVQHPTLMQPDAKFLLEKDVDNQRLYRNAYEQTIQAVYPQGYGPEHIWTGRAYGAMNPKGAVLTIFRNGTSATVVEGARGPRPPTLWLMSYAGIERLYYNLAAQFKYWGHAHHQAETWVFMSNIRGQYEEDFISLLPTDNMRDDVRDHWTKGLAGTFIMLARKSPNSKRPSQFKNIRPKSPVDDLVGQLRTIVGPAAMGPFDDIDRPEATTDNSEQAQFERALRNVVLDKTNSAKKHFATHLPDITLVRLSTSQGDVVYSLLAYKGYKFHNGIVAEKLARDEGQDHLTAHRGVIGDFPNLMVNLRFDQSAEFLKRIVAIRSDADFRQFQEDYGVLRRDKDGDNRIGFWTSLHKIQDWNRQQEGVEAGLLDLNYYGGY